MGGIHDTGRSADNQDRPGPGERQANKLEEEGFYSFSRPGRVSLDGSELSREDNT